MSSNNVLFIADGSINNPILQSQGLPYLFNISSPSNRAHTLSFEKMEFDSETDIEIKSLISNYSNRINFHFVGINKSGFFPLWVDFIWEGIKAIKKIDRKYGIKILHARSFFPAVISIIYKILFNKTCKVLYDNRGLVIEERIFNGELKRNSSKEKVLRWIEKKVIDKCDSMVVVSKAFRDYIFESYPDNLVGLKNKVNIIPNRTSLLLNEKEILEVKKKMKDETVCVYNGSAAAWQGTSKLYDVFSLILKDIPSSTFKVITYHPEPFKNNPPKNNLLKERIKILKVPSSEVKNELVKSSFGILLREPSLASKVSSPIKFAEYLAAGLPVMLLEGITDIEEIVDKYGVGVVIRNNDFEYAVKEMKKLINEEDLFAKCLEVAKLEFDIKNSFEQYRNIYKSIFI